MKTKLRWEFPTRIHTVTVLPSEMARTHQETTRPLVMHNCLYGYNEQDTVVKILYCTRSVRFFTRKGEDWSEQIPDTTLVRRGKENAWPAAGGCCDTAYMRHFGNTKCYRLIAYAWCEWPEEAKTDPLWYKRFEVDHLNGDHSDSSPENLRWLTPQQNRAWAKRQRAMRKIGLDLRHIPYTLLLRISDLSDFGFDTFLSLIQETFASDTRELTIDNINFDIAHTLDWIAKHTIHCARCQCEMIEDNEEHNTHYGTLCDCCYDELYG